MRLFICIIFLSAIGCQCYSQNWQSLAGGLGIWGARTMYADSNYLYVSGNFSIVDGKHFKGIARWNGSQWDSLSTGVNGMDTVNQWPGGFITTMIPFNNKLYVCGGFNSLGHIHADGFGTWNGLSWDTTAIQPGGGGCLFVSNNELYLGGSFDTLAGIAANSIIKWNGTTWQSLGFPNFYLYPFIDTYASIMSICEYNGRIYAAGAFESYPLGTDTVGNILCYDGGNWTSVAGGVKGFNAGIGDMVVYHGELYVGGLFSKADGNPGENIQKWNGTSWSDVGGGTGVSNANVFKLLIWQDKLYAIGMFQQAGGIPADGIAVWDGIKWCGLGSNFDNSILAAAAYHDSLFVGGGFRTIDGDTMNFIAKWTGGNFTDTCSTIGINENEQLLSEFYVYPNPTSSHITINSSISFSHLLIRDAIGRILITQTLPANTTHKELCISELAAGVYFVTVESERGRVTRKLVKE